MKNILSPLCLDIINKGFDKTLLARTLWITIMEMNVQYDKDISSEHAELFMQTTEYLSSMIGETLHVKYSSYITSFFSESGGICYVKTDQNGVRIGWFRGAFIEDRFGKLSGNGKSMRAHALTKLDRLEKEAIAYYVQESIFFLLGHAERLRMKKHFKN